ncbi:fatty acid desaturase [uncultured Pseudomonas sp.]|uniref:fatty acid desaturase family protein n=1 Tax=uncultured Pseudomonas sp. TaxID=114707 RepID=UPI0025DA726A|nr:fatty acid desaturase [uncultured Pseudomonas sp.]
MSSAYADLYLNALKNPALRKDLIAIAKKRNKTLSVLMPLLTALLIVAGIYCSSASLVWLLIGIPLITMGKIWAWYLGHEYAHNCAFKSKKTNALLGEFVSFINGLSFSSFEEYQHLHNRHHADKVDLVGFDIRQFKSDHPRAYQVMEYLERIYVPGFYYLIKLYGIGATLKSGTRQEKGRAVIATLLYVSGYALGIVYCLPALIAWQIASLIRIHVVRFVDCFQHSFEQIQLDEPSANKSDKHFEILNTFSIPVARKHTYLNLLILNFGYHNAHHSFPTCPWYFLPELERRILQEMSSQVSQCHTAYLRESALNFLDLLRLYRKHHLKRIASDKEGNPYDVDGNFKLEDFTGAYTDKLLG